MSPGAAAALAAEIAALDAKMLERQRAALRAPPEAAAVEDLEPPELLPPSSRIEDPRVRNAAERGWEELRGGRVAVVTVAGGQASRLGFEGPKGAYPLGPISGASLFQILAGAVHRMRERAGAPLPWVLMTGPENDAATRAYFAARNHFGLDARSVHFACQGTLPALTPDGELLRAAPDRLFRNPDGHGGLYRSLARDGLLERLGNGGVSTLFTCQVDNALAPVADPAFLGFHLGSAARISSKAVVKTEASEKVGLLAECGGLLQCVEYSDLPAAAQQTRASDGGLRLRAGNIAMHAIDLTFAQEMAAADLPLHLARKQVRALGPDGLLASVPAVKFETFVFDALPLAGRGGCLVQEADRAEEFAPLKNRSGADSIASARTALGARARRWMEAAGLGSSASGVLELAPGLAVDAADLRSRKDEVELHGGRLLRLRPHSTARS
ncbi:MAG: UTP--glucose-1-phosphate uridylyltransferase [Planctomycetota bacterium]|nr:UTP--glucose-1-phosphate uridylyltransferase [Planctomycetota bacterium]